MGGWVVGGWSGDRRDECYTSTSLIEAVKKLLSTPIHVREEVFHCGHMILPCYRFS